MSAPPTIAGTIKIGWQITERDLCLPNNPDAEDYREAYERLEEILGAIISQTVDLWVDGEKKPPVRVFLENMGEIEVDDGPHNGSLEDIRLELEDEDTEG